MFITYEGICIRKSSIEYVHIEMRGEYASQGYRLVIGLISGKELAYYCKGHTDKKVQDFLHALNKP